jgi:hypothetical protein
MARTRPRAPRGTFYKTQTRWSRWPAVMVANRCGDGCIFIEITSSWPCGSQKPPASEIAVSAHEAQAFAAWLSEQAEHLLAKASRKAKRTELAKLKKEGKEHGDRE